MKLSLSYFSTTMNVMLIISLLTTTMVIADPSCSPANNCQLETSTNIAFPLVHHDIKNKRICKIYQLAHYDKTLVIWPKTVIVMGIYECKKDKTMIHREIKKHSTTTTVIENTKDDKSDLMFLLKPYMSHIPNALYKWYLQSDIQKRGSELKLEEKYIDLLKESIKKSINRDLIYGDTITIQMTPNKSDQLSVKHEGHDYDGVPFSTNYTQNKFPRRIFYQLFEILKKEYKSGITYTNPEIKLNF